MIIFKTFFLPYFRVVLKGESYSSVNLSNAITWGIFKIMYANTVSWHACLRFPLVFFADSLVAFWYVQGHWNGGSCFRTLAGTGGA